MRDRPGWIMPVATIAGIAAGLWWFATAPIPRPRGGDSALTSPRAARTPPWHEWRSDQFRSYAANLDRSDPAAIVAAVLRAHASNRYDLDLAFGSEFRQTRWMPDTLRDAFARSPALARPESFEIAEPIIRGARATVPYSARNADDSVHTRALLRYRAGWGWELDLMNAGPVPATRPWHSASRSAARAAFIPITRDALRGEFDSPEALAERLLDAALAGFPGYAGTLAVENPLDPFLYEAFAELLHNPLRTRDDFDYRVIGSQPAEPGALVGVELRSTDRSLPLTLHCLPDDNIGWRLASIHRIPTPRQFVP